MAPRPRKTVKAPAPKRKCRSTGKRTALNHEHRMAICRHSKENVTLTNRQIVGWALSQLQIKVHETTVCRLRQNSDSVLANTVSKDTQRIRSCVNPLVENALFKWLVLVQESRLPISDNLVMEKAKALHQAAQQRDPTGIRDCKYSSGWLTGFKRRHDICLYTLHGEDESCVLSPQSWDNFARMEAIVCTYNPKDVFNMDETGLFYKLQPNKTLKDNASAGTKIFKDRITVGLCSNMDGSFKLPPLVINRSKNPRSFSSRRVKRPDNLGVHWFHNRGAWMTNEVFEEWVLKFEGLMVAQGRKKVLLILDNAPGHQENLLAGKLKVTRLIFLPPNTTARFQPMDVGIIKSFKAHYRRLMIWKWLQDFNNGKPLLMNVYFAVLLLVQAWEEVSKQTIANCWKHCSLVPHVDAHCDKRPRLHVDLEAEATAEQEADRTESKGEGNESEGEGNESESEGNESKGDGDSHGGEGQQLGTPMPRPEIDINATLVDPDLDRAMEQLADALDQLRFQFPVDMTAQEWIDQDCPEVCPTFDLNLDPKSWLSTADGGEVVDAVDDPEAEGESESDATDGDTPQMSYEIGMIHMREALVFLQQQEYDTTALSISLKKIQAAVSEAHLATTHQGMLDGWLENPEPVQHRP